MGIMQDQIIEIEGKKIATKALVNELCQMINLSNVSYCFPELPNSDNSDDKSIKLILIKISLIDMNRLFWQDIIEIRRDPKLRKNL